MLAVSVLSSCAYYDAALDNPQIYNEVASNRRIVVPCYYTLAPATGVLIVHRLWYRVRMGPAISEQLRAALGGLCRGTGRVRDRAEFLSVTKDEPAVLFTVEATASMTPSLFLFQSNKGEVRGRAIVTGPGGSGSLTYEFSARGEKSPDFLDDSGSGAEGLRRALGKAIQKLVDNVEQDRARIERLAATRGAANGTVGHRKVD